MKRWTIGLEKGSDLLPRLTSKELDTLSEEDRAEYLAIIALQSLYRKNTLAFNLAGFTVGAVAGIELPSNRHLIDYLYKSLNRKEFVIYVGTIAEVIGWK